MNIGRKQLVFSGNPKKRRRNFGASSIDYEDTGAGEERRENGFTYLPVQHGGYARSMDTATAMTRKTQEHVRQNAELVKDVSSSAEAVAAGAREMAELTGALREKIGKFTVA